MDIPASAQLMDLSLYANRFYSQHSALQSDDVVQHYGRALWWSRDAFRPPSQSDVGVQRDVKDMVSVFNVEST